MNTERWIITLLCVLHVAAAKKAFAATSAAVTSCWVNVVFWSGKVGLAVTRGNMRRQTPPRGRPLLDTTAWRSPCDWTWPTPAARQHTANLWLTHSTCTRCTRVWCVCLWIPVCSADRLRSLCIGRSNRQSPSFRQTSRQLHPRRRRRRRPRCLYSSRRAWETLSLRRESRVDTMRLFAQQARTTSHSTPAKTSEHPKNVKFICIVMLTWRFLQPITKILKFLLTIISLFCDAGGD